MPDIPKSHRAVDEQHGLVSSRGSQIGNVKRITGLDELPQIFSILKGITSITGPRAQTDEVLETRLRAAPTLFNDWFTEFYEPFKKGWISPGANWFHRFVPSQTLSPEQVITGVMERDLAWVPQANLAYDLRLIAEAPIDIAWGLGHHLLQMRSTSNELA